MSGRKSNWDQNVGRRPAGAKRPTCAYGMEVLEDRCLLSYAPITSELLITDGLSPSANFFPAVTVDAIGNFVVSWQTFTADPADGGMRIARFDALGNPLSPAEPATSPGSIFQSHATIAANGSGDFVLAWQELGDIYALRFDAAGVVQGSVIEVSLGARFDVHAQVAIDADGDFTIVWHATGGTAEGIYARRYDSSGSALGSEFRVDIPNGTRVADASIAMDAEGDFVVTWTGAETSNVAGNTNAGIYARRYSSAGIAADAAPVLVSGPLADRVSRSAVAMDAEGNYVIAWQADNGSSSYDIYARRYRASGMALTSTSLVNEQTAGAQRNVAVAMNAAGEMVFTWEGPSEQGSFSVWVRRYDAAGLPLGSDDLVGAADDALSFPDVAIDDEGDFVVVWHTTTGIMARIYQEDLPPTTTGIPSFVADEDSVLEVQIDLTRYFDDREDLPDGLHYQLVAISETDGFLNSQLLLNGVLTITWSPNAFGSAEITIRATDRSGQFVDAVYRLDILSVNDAPTLTVPASLTVEADSVTLLAGLQVADIDSNDLEILLEAAGGTLLLGSIGNLQSITGNGTGVLELRGTADAINQALATLSFHAGSAAGAANVTVTVRDFLAGEVGLSASGNIAIDVLLDPGPGPGPNPPPTPGPGPATPIVPLVFEPFLLSTIFVSPTTASFIAGNALTPLDNSSSGYADNDASLSAGLLRSRDARSTASGQSGLLDQAGAAALEQWLDESAGWDLASQVAMRQSSGGRASMDERRQGSQGTLERMVDFWEGPAGMLNSALSGSDDSVPLIERLLTEPEESSRSANAEMFRELWEGMRQGSVPFHDLATAAKAIWSTLAIDLVLSEASAATSFQPMEATVPATSDPLVIDADVDVSVNSFGWVLAVGVGLAGLTGALLTLRCYGESAKGGAYSTRPSIDETEPGVSSRAMKEGPL